MQRKARYIQAYPSQDSGKPSHQITYEWGNSRRTLNTGAKSETGESPPHAAGSFHDPAHHFELLNRVEQLLRSS